MTFCIKITGGTNAGCKRPLLIREWTCKCGRKSIAYSCADCGERRPA